MKINLSGMQETLLLPLWSRINFGKDNNSILIDPMAAEIVKKIKYDFNKIDKHFPYFLQLQNAVRTKMLDNTIEEFLKDNPKATVVNLGAGLDTTFYRLDNGQLNWYNIDLPDVIEIRNKLMPATDRQNNIAGSIFEMNWVKAITRVKDGILFISNGVLEYFHESVVKKFLSDTADSFPKSEIVFNTIRRNFISSYFTKRMMKQLGMESANTKWGIKDPDKIKQWDKRFVILESYPLFTKIKIQKNWDADHIKAMDRFDKWRAINIVHLKFMK